jgi:hypothetical protein
MGADLTYLTSVDTILALIRGDGVLIGVQWVRSLWQSWARPRMWGVVRMRSEYDRKCRCVGDNTIISSISL